VSNSNFQHQATECWQCWQCVFSAN